MSAGTSRRELRPVMRVNGDFLGCIVEPGRSKIEFRFRPASLRYGKLSSIFGLSFLGAMLLLVAGREIRKSKQPISPNIPPRPIRSGFRSP